MQHSKTQYKTTLELLIVTCKIIHTANFDVQLVVFFQVHEMVFRAICVLTRHIIIILITKSVPQK